ncbi:nucleoside diphosphate kinase regulator [Pelagibacterium mangrovi]|uniref:nucleoside diphosphate kinase regulator n=1 Tax=Pelagibacterium mangrovi TaxID=3119828 RepID=UPI002FC7BA4F
MSLFAPHGQLPAILVSQDDFELLSRLASAGRGETAEDLMSELERATLADPIPADIVRMGSTVSYAINDEGPRTVRLVYPADADISSGAISVLTPIGTALLGLSPGQSIGWTARDGHERQLEVIAVSNDDANTQANGAIQPSPEAPGPFAA